MILLILVFNLYNDNDRKKNLNSIMILLIPTSSIRPYSSAVSFKFHYDSINSQVSFRPDQSWSEFKFHYDSINSGFLPEDLGSTEVNLNSIMILLILHENLYYCLIIILFKFHYDSINSFPPASYNHSLI